jgi:dihydrofolate reductase
MRMPKVRVHNFTMSLDGYAAGPDQDLDNPMGVGGHRLHEWAFATPTFQAMLGTGSGGAVDSIDNKFAAAGDIGVGATIMGRNMFGPIRDDWGDEGWTGWWGDEPPYHHPVFVLTHHARASFEMQGGTTFHFVTDGIESALEQALDAAGGADVRIGGGASTVRQYLRLGAIDEMHVAIAPILLGSGERLFEPADGVNWNYECVEMIGSPAVVHTRFARIVAR